MAEPADMDTQRAIGRLEGRMTSLEVQVHDSALRTDRQVTALTGEVMSIRGRVDKANEAIAQVQNTVGDIGGLKDTVNQLRSTVEGAKNRFTGGWHVLVIIVLVVSTMLNMLLAAVQAFHPFK